MFRSVYCLCVNVCCAAATGCQPKCGEIKSRIAMAKTAFNKKKTLFNSFYQQIGLKFEEETGKMLHLERSFVWC
jgi:hypothetical protein